MLRMTVAFAFAIAAAGPAAAVAQEASSSSTYVLRSNQDFDSVNLPARSWIATPLASSEILASHDELVPPDGKRWILPVAGAVLGAGVGIWWGSRIIAGPDEWVAVPPHVYTVPISAAAGLVLGILANGNPDE